MAKIIHKTLRQEVAEAIRMKILTGEILPGCRIVEQEMAGNLGVSRGPVREALRQIEQEGLIQYTSHIGCSVKMVSTQDIYEIYLLRANLEILAVKLCDGKFSENCISEMEKIVTGMSNMEDENAFDLAIEYDNSFHACLVKDINLDRLYKLWSSMDAGNRIIFYTGIKKTLDVVLNQQVIHRNVLDAVKSANPNEISRVLMEHYMSTIKNRVHENDVEQFRYKMNFEM